MECENCSMQIVSVHEISGLKPRNSVMDENWTGFTLEEHFSKLNEFIIFCTSKDRAFDYSYLAHYIKNDKAIIVSEVPERGGYEINEYAVFIEKSIMRFVDFYQRNYDIKVLGRITSNREKPDDLSLLNLLGYESLLSNNSKEE